MDLSGDYGKKKKNAWNLYIMDILINFVATWHL